MSSGLDKKAGIISRDNFLEHAVNFNGQMNWPWN